MLHNTAADFGNFSNIRITQVTKVGTNQKIWRYGACREQDLGNSGIVLTSWRRDL